MTDIEKLEKQTHLLLEKQHESEQYCTDQFNEFLSLIQQEIENATVSLEKEKIKKLQTLCSIINDHAKQFQQDIGNDITYLVEQLDVIKQLKEEKDESKRVELIDLMMEGEKISDIKTFQEELEVEAIEAKESFRAVMDDLKQTLIEGSVDELLIYLQEIGSQKDERKNEEESLEPLGKDIIFSDVANQDESSECSAAEEQCETCTVQCSEKDDCDETGCSKDDS